MMKISALTAASPLLAFAALLTHCAANAADKSTHYFLVGNSLTWDTVPSKLGERARCFAAPSSIAV